jgi:hypothetical protein
VIRGSPVATPLGVHQVPFVRSFAPVLVDDVYRPAPVGMHAQISSRGGRAKVDRTGPGQASVARRNVANNRPITGHALEPEQIQHSIVSENGPDLSSRLLAGAANQACISPRTASIFGDL